VKVSTVHERRLRVALWATSGFALAAGALSAACSLVYDLSGFDRGSSSGAGDASGGSYPGFACGDGGVCVDPATEVCCLPGGPNMFHGLCLATSQCFDDSAQCRAPVDCMHSGVKDGVCCYVVTPSTGMGTHVYAKCVAPASCETRIQFCDPKASTPCPNGGACTPSAEIGGLFNCPLQ
jgi:hypothetical protein